MSSEANATNAFIVLLTGGGVIAAVNENATLISISIAAIGLLMGLFFHVLAVIDRRKVEKRNSEEYKEKLKQEIMQELFDKESDK